MPEASDGSRLWRSVWTLVAAGSATAFLVLSVLAARMETPTIDEFAHVPSGVLGLTQQRYDLYSRNPPLLKMAMAAPVLLAGAVVPDVTGPDDAWRPWRYGRTFMAANADRYFTLFWLARLVPILCGLLTGVVIFAWARELFGLRSAAVTASMFYLNPNVLAHSHLATVDAGSMLTIVLSIYGLHRAYRRPAGWRVGGAGAVWGLALLTKFTAVLLFPVLILGILIHRRRAWVISARDVAVLAGSAWLVVNLGMGFQGSFRPLSSYRLISDFGSAVQQTLPADWPVPLPAEWVKGFDLQKLEAEEGEAGNYRFYLFGEWSARGWWYYDLVAMVAKNPLPLVLLIAVCPWFWARSSIARSTLWEVVLPVLVLVGSMMLFNRLNVGVRYLLPALPFLLLLTSIIWRGRERWQARAAVAVLACHAAVALWVFPAYLSYFNVAAGGTRSGYRVLLDSNMDWGQDLYRLPGTLAKLGYAGRIGLLYLGHVDPALYGIQYDLLPDHPAEGVFAVSVQYLEGGSYVATSPDGEMVSIEGGQAAWLRDHEPVARAGSMWIFDTRGRLRSR